MAIGHRLQADATMQDFRNIEAWHVAHQLTLAVYDITHSFPKHELYGLTSQLRRACASIPTNIAEGCVRRTDSDFARFLYISLSSASEVEYLLLLSHEQSYIGREQHQSLTEEAQRVKRMLASFIRRLEQGAPSGQDNPQHQKTRKPIANC